MIALLPGDQSPTHHYVELDIQMKVRCLRKPQSPKIKTGRCKRSDQLLAFLQNL